MKEKKKKRNEKMKISTNGEEENHENENGENGIEGNRRRIGNNSIAYAHRLMAK
jgi:hypothetical protein